MDLAQAMQHAVEEPGRLLGLTVGEWGLLLPALAAFVVAVLKAWKGAKDGKRLEAVVHAIEEVAEDHPGAIKVVKRVARDKATKLGVQAGLHAEAQRATQRLQKRNGTTAT